MDVGDTHLSVVARAGRAEMSWMPVTRPERRIIVLESGGENGCFQDRMAGGDEHRLLHLRLVLRLQNGCASRTGAEEPF